MTVDMDRILDAIIACDASPTAKEEATPLIEAWIQKHGEFDASYDTIAVECPFYIWLEYTKNAKTLVVGMIDRVARADSQLFPCEWKTAKAPRINKDGTDNKWWNEDVWLRSMQDGAQLPIYALAMNKGVLIRGIEHWRPSAPAPVSVLVRAALKTPNADRWWPENNSPIFDISQARLDATEDALIQKANAIRAMRKSDLIPWQLTGRQCYPFNRVCEFKELCDSNQHPPVAPSTLMDMNNPGSAALEYALGIKGKTAEEMIFDKTLVVLSYSGYTNASECLERFRITSGSLGQSETSHALEVGSVFHAGIAAFYEQLLVEE